jgi:hypothetical protein
MSKHTPGPWIITGSMISSDDDTTVCLLTSYRDMTPRQTANARLIAASPVMLEALKELDSWLVCACIATPEDMAQSFPHMQQVVSAAIFKATGEA